MSRFGASFTTVICLFVILTGQSSALLTFYQQYPWQHILYPNFQGNYKGFIASANVVYTCAETYALVKISF